MKTPDHADTTVINELFEKYAEPMKLGPAPKLNAECLLGNKPIGVDFDLTQYPDLRPSWTKTPVGWMCVDDNSYDGPGSPVGWGALKIDALSDLIEQIEEARKPRRAGRVTHSSPFEPPTIVDEPQSDPDLDAGYEP